ncbi:MAG TPA: 4-phosphoerythronate dehydrogenase, partial [Salinibacter sp.]|nr:4-phosphoerythronate dehydrogenase [Salinibacter sp.]
MSDLLILADENIPCVEDAFGPFGTVMRYEGRALGPDDVRDADVLLVRSVTDVGSGLLEGSSVQFVGSATIGTDHVDRGYLSEKGIAFAHAPASNADSVADYVIAALLLLARRKQVPLRALTVGIVGCGNIGGRLAQRLPALGPRVLRNDPPLADAAEAAGESHDFVSFETVCQEADVITLHVPLTDEGPYPTHHLMDDEVFSRLQTGTWVLNAARGPVVDNDALLAALEEGTVGAAVLDVWEDEPTPNPALIETVDVATPHIAGYAYDGKVRGTTMLYEALCAHLDVDPSWDPSTALRPEHADGLCCTPPDLHLPRTD